MARYSISRLFSLLETILANQEKERSLMSALSDAVKSLTAANVAEHEEVQLVLKAVQEFPSKLQTAIDQAVANGASVDDLVGIKVVVDQQAADAKAMADALAAPAPTTPTA
jgi:sugar-specific transcriptional regulator TrmB